MDNRNRRNNTGSDGEAKLIERVAFLSSVSPKRQQAGNYMTFSALVVRRRREGLALAVGLGTCQEVPSCYKKL